jgi:hypothetical protein
MFMEKTILQQENKTTTKSSSFFKPTIQKKLSVGSANDSYEVEADNMANKVMRMSIPENQNISNAGALVQKKCAACEQEEKLQMKPLAESITPLIQRSSSESGGLAPSHVESQINSSRGSGTSLDHSTKNFMESRFGTDFSDVKIHTGSQAVQMSRDLNAQAFTVGNDIYFNEGKYSPNSDSGRHLLAHELTHTVQQGKSSGLAMRRIQRSVTTWGGTWDTDQYDLVTPVTASGSRGAEIKIKFSPGVNANAELIGLTQTAQAIKAGSPNYIGDATRQSHGITSGDAIGKGAGTDEATHIDRIGSRNNPIYGSTSLTSTQNLGDTPLSNNSTSNPINLGVNATYQLGFRFTSGTTLNVQDAKMYDKPTQVNVEKDSSNIFETTAVGLKGTQTGVYYGSVQWGWRTDSAGTFTKIPFSVVSQGVPSSSFMKAAELWNAGKDSTGTDTANLPIVDVMVTTAAITTQLPITFVGPPLTIPIGTRVELMQNIPFINAKVRIVDGPHTGNVYEILRSDIANLMDERP